MGRVIPIDASRLDLGAKYWNAQHFELAVLRPSLHSYDGCGHN